MNDVNDSPNPVLSIEELARLFAQHMPHGRDIGIRLDQLAADGKTRMGLPAQAFLAGDAGASFFFPGVMFSLPTRPAVWGNRTFRAD